jgi:DNA modification methylase
MTGSYGRHEQAWPADKVERKAVSALVPFARNSRTHSDDQIEQVARSIAEWGWTNPALIAEDGTIIAGHARVLAARKLGLEEVPAMVTRGWSEAQIRAYVIADNKLAENAGWDRKMLASELHELAGGFDLSLVGFSEQELAALAVRTNAGLTDPDEIPELPEHPVSKAGDIGLLGRHRLVCGDCTDPIVVEACLNGVAPHLMVTDPPYGVAYDPAWRARAGVNLNKRKLGKVDNDDRADWREAWALFRGDVAYVWHAGRFESVVAASLEACGFTLRAQIIWGKDRFALSRGDYHWQPCWYAVREGGKGHWSGGRSQSTLWTIPARDDSGHGHGTQKPVECMRRPIENNSSPGQAVYDPFVGSGTSIIAAEMTGRICHAIEIDPAYVDVAVKRWQDFMGEVGKPLYRASTR